MKNGRYYIGYTGDLERRIIAHNTGGTRSTRPYRPWQLIYSEEYNTKREAMRRERELKRYKSG